MSSQRPLHVYLDINHWHALAEAAGGHPRSLADPAVLLQLTNLVDQGVIALPLSGLHYMELAEYANDANRAATANVMARLSLFQTTAPPDAILQEEIEQSLHDRFGRPAHPTMVVKFGVGAGFAFGEPLNLRLDWDSTKQREEWEARTGTTAASLLARYQATAEFLLLVGPPRAHTQQIPGYDPYAARRQADQELQSLQVMITNLTTETELAHRPKDAIVARQLMFDMRALLTPSMIRAGFGIDDWPLDDKDDLTAFLVSLPSRKVATELQIYIVRDHTCSWKISDLRDIDALSIAVPYCDVVVTDKAAWAAVTGQHLDTTFNTVVLRRLSDLGVYLTTLPDHGQQPASNAP